MAYNYNYNELYHYGIPRRSGRYPYGSGDRPYQSSGGVSTRKVSRSGRLTIRQRIANRRAAAQKASKEKEMKREQEARAQHERNKERVLREGTALELKEYANELSNAELESAIKRLELNKKLNSYSKKEVQTTFDKVDNFMSKAGKVNNWATTSINAYNNVQQFKKIYDELYKQAQKQAGKEKKSA